MRTRRIGHTLTAVMLASVAAADRLAAQSSAAPGAQAFRIEIVVGHSLQGDGLGVYRDGEAGVGAFGLNGITLCTDGRRCGTLPEAAPPSPSARTLVLALTTPIPGTPAIPRGVIRAQKANFGAFWEQDTTTRASYNGREGWAIRSALNIPVGRTVESQRVEIRFFTNDKQYILQFGPWTAGQYQPDQGPLSGEGSTRATITRATDTTWVVRSGDRGVGRLWDNSEPTHPVDLGLYAFSFEVRYTSIRRQGARK